MGGGLATYPTKIVAAGALCMDASGRLLLVKPTYKPRWEIPGGVVEPGESPREGGARELREELGMAVEPGRLLCVDYRSATAEHGDSLQFVFDGGVLDESRVREIVLPSGRTQRTEVRRTVGSTGARLGGPRAKDRRGTRRQIAGCHGVRRQRRAAPLSASTVPRSCSAALMYDAEAGPERREGRHGAHSHWI